MKRPWTVFFSGGFLALFISGDATSQGIPAQDAPKPASPLQPTLQPILTGKYRLFRDSQTIAISQGNQQITVEYFTELVVACEMAGGTDADLTILTECIDSPASAGDDHISQPNVPPIARNEVQVPLRKERRRQDV
jgi:hypothetical protein